MTHDFETFQSAALAEGFDEVLNACGPRTPCWTRTPTRLR